MKQRNDGIIIRPPQSRDFKGILDLRWKVLDEPAGCIRQTNLSENDRKPEAIHVIAVDKNFVVSAVRLDPNSRNGATYMVCRMATDPNYQKRGIGKDVLRKAEQIAKEKGVEQLILNSRMGAVAFYEAVGYESKNSIEVHDGGENLVMEKQL